MSSPSTPVCVQPRIWANDEDEAAYDQMENVLAVLGYDQDIIHHHIMSPADDTNERSQFAEYVFVKKAGTTSLYDGCMKPLKLVDGLGIQSTSCSSLYDIYFDVLDRRKMWLDNITKELDRSDRSKFIHTISFVIGTVGSAQQSHLRHAVDDVCSAALQRMPYEGSAVLRYVLEFGVLSFKMVMRRTDGSLNGYLINIDDEKQAVSDICRLITATSTRVLRMV